MALTQYCVDTARMALVGPALNLADDNHGSYGFAQEADLQHRTNRSAYCFGLATYDRACRKWARK